MTKSIALLNGESNRAGARLEAFHAVSVSRDMFRLAGADALDLLNRLSTNALGKMEVGEARETLLTTEKGRIIDLLLVARFTDGLLVLCSAGRAGAVAEWIKKFTITDDVTIEQLTHNTTISWLYSPNVTSRPIISAATDSPLGADTCVFDTPLDLRLIAVGNARGGHVFVLGPRESRDLVLAQCGAEVIPEDQAELLRIRACIPSWPNELNEEFNPYDVGLVDAVSFTKGCYIGQEVIARMDTYKKVRRGLAGIEFPGGVREALPATIYDETGEIGLLTSVARDDKRGSSFGLAVVRLERVRPGLGVYIQSSSANVRGHITQLPKELQ